MSKSLPSRPDPSQLRKQAKDLLKAFKSGDPEAQRRVQESHGGGAGRYRASALPESFKLAAAQRVIAQEYGFPNWARLKTAVEDRLLEGGDPVDLMKKAVEADEPAFLARLLRRHPELKPRLNEPLWAFDSPAITVARSRRMLDTLLEAGADINSRSQWWAGGFGILDGIHRSLAPYAVARGARVNAHAAARLGMTDRLRELIDGDPDCVHARGGDGQTPLHMAQTVEIAELLVRHGADIDAIDVDHESTPAQYMVRDRQAVARHLVSSGCRTDLLLATALGDVDHVRRHLDADPASIRVAVNNTWFPRRNPHSGGTIYIWTLGQNKSAHAVARDFRHREVLELLLDRSPVELRFVRAAQFGDHAGVESLLRRRPDLVRTLSPDDLPALSYAAMANDIAAVRLMVSIGWPIDATGQHGGTALHWAAFHGNAGMTRELLNGHPALEIRDPEFQATPLGWAIHGSEHGWHCDSGQYGETVEALLAAGARPPDQVRGTEEVRNILGRGK